MTGNVWSRPSTRIFVERNTRDANYVKVLLLDDSPTTNSSFTSALLVGDNIIDKCTQTQY